MTLEPNANKRQRAQEQVRRARLRDFLESLERDNWEDTSSDAGYDSELQEGELVAETSLSFPTAALPVNALTGTTHRVPDSQQVRQRRKRRDSRAEIDSERASNSGGAVADQRTMESTPTSDLDSQLGNGPRRPPWKLSHLVRLNYRYAWLAQRGSLEGWLYFTSAPATASARPARHLCDVCGFGACYTCPRCGGFTCSLACTRTHRETRCLRTWQT
jgi:hypothetical protein